MTGADINDVFFIIGRCRRFGIWCLYEVTEISANPEEGNVPLFYLLYSITMLSYSDILPEIYPIYIRSNYLIY